jgi:hypothetical protein
MTKAACTRARSRSAAVSAATSPANAAWTFSAAAAQTSPVHGSTSRHMATLLTGVT